MKTIWISAAPQSAKFHIVPIYHQTPDVWHKKKKCWRSTCVQVLKSPAVMQKTSHNMFCGACSGCAGLVTPLSTTWCCRLLCASVVQQRRQLFFSPILDLRLWVERCYSILFIPFFCFLFFSRFGFWRPVAFLWLHTFSSLGVIPVLDRSL